MAEMYILTALLTSAFSDVGINRFMYRWQYSPHRFNTCILDYVFMYLAPKFAGVSETEREAVSYCTLPKHGSRLIPPDTFTSLHFV
jgi:hypothetical protein